MAFIKLAEIIVNTNYIAAVRLEGQTRTGEERVSLLIAIPTVTLRQADVAPSDTYHYEWLEFTGDSAKALQDYFTSFNNVIDLVPATCPCTR